MSEIGKDHLDLLFLKAIKDFQLCLDALTKMESYDQQKLPSDETRSLFYKALFIRLNKGINRVHSLRGESSQLITTYENEYRKLEESIKIERDEIDQWL